MNTLDSNPYVQEILSQADSVKNALNGFDAAALKPLMQSVQAGGFERIVLTGMGASLFASYPVWLQLVDAGLPAHWIDCAEIIHHARPLLTKRTLVWIASQSGRSAEIVAALDLIKQAGAKLLATVNDLTSPLAQAADYRVPIHAEVEKTVSTRTYVNTLAVGQLAALALSNGDVPKGLDELHRTAGGMGDYFADWVNYLQTIKDRFKRTSSLYLLGRGASLASAYTGALILGEASKTPAAGMQAGEFRHGPMELASSNLTALLFAGPPETQGLNLRLHQDLMAAGTHSIWIASPDAPQPEPQIRMPYAVGIGLPLAEIVPIQMLTIHLALENGVEPGKFFRSGKVTLSE